MCDIQISYKGTVIITGKMPYIPRIGERLAFTFVPIKYWRVKDVTYVLNDRESTTMALIEVDKEELK